MKTYIVNVKVRHTIINEAYVDIEVEADSEETAEEEAITQLEKDNYKKLWERTPEFDLDDDSVDLEVNSAERADDGDASEEE